MNIVIKCVCGTPLELCSDPYNNKGVVQLTVARCVECSKCVVSASLRDMDDWWAGYESAAKEYSWWKDGIKYVHVGTYTLEEALKRARKFVKPSGCGNQELKTALLTLLKLTKDCDSFHMTFDGVPAEDCVAEILGVDSSALEAVLQGEGDANDKETQIKET